MSDGANRSLTQLQLEAAMPVHDWTRVDAWLFHAFHQRWISALCDALNSGGLPAEYFALPEQSIRGPIPDILTLKLSPAPTTPAVPTPESVMPKK